MAPAQLKGLLLPIATQMGMDVSAPGVMREVMTRCKKLALQLALKRRPNKKNPEFPNADIKDLILL
jgi:hypothetical protein